MSDHTFLSAIHDGSDLWTIAVRVLRKWNVYQKTNPHELFCVAMLLVDAEGTTIQASAILKSMPSTFYAYIKEGETYEIANFVVSANTSKYRPTTHPFKLTFTTHTSISQIQADLPTSSYAFKSISDLISLAHEDDIDYLFDVIAFVKSIGSLDQQCKDNHTKYWLRMILTDIHENEIECVLFDQCASDAYLDQLQNTDTPVVVLLNLAKLSWTEDNKRQLSSSFTATRVNFNPKIKEVNDLIQRAKEQSSPLLEALSQSMPTQLSRHSSNSSLLNQPKISISNINDLSAGSIFILECEIVKFESKHGWTYDGCTKCSSKAKLKDENDPLSPLICPSCKPPNHSNSGPSFEPKMKLHYMVKDDSGTTSVIFWDKLAIQLMDKTAFQMKLTLPEDKRKVGFPKGLENPVGKKLLLKLKLNEFNKKYPGSSISALEFTICQDLLNEFNSVSAEFSLQDPGLSQLQPFEGDGSGTTSTTNQLQAVADLDKQQSNPVEKNVVDVEDDTLASISHQVTQAPTKGKRKSYTKRTAIMAESTKETQSSVNPQDVGNLIKIIKQEKI